MEIFNLFLEKREDIEKTFGDKLEWQPLEGRRACRIKKDIAMIRLDKSLKPYFSLVQAYMIGLK